MQAFKKVCSEIIIIEQSCGWGGGGGDLRDVWVEFC